MRSYLRGLNVIKLAGSKVIERIMCVYFVPLSVYEQNKQKSDFRQLFTWQKCHVQNLLSTGKLDSKLHTSFALHTDVGRIRISRTCNNNI